MSSWRLSGSISERDRRVSRACESIVLVWRGYAKDRELVVIWLLIIGLISFQVWLRDAAHEPPVQSPRDE
jgi:hypothetical protein